MRPVGASKLEVIEWKSDVLGTWLGSVHIGEGDVQALVWRRIGGHDFHSNVFLFEIVATKPYRTKTPMAEFMDDTIAIFWAKAIAEMNWVIPSLFVVFQILESMVAVFNVCTVGCRRRMTA